MWKLYFRLLLKIIRRLIDFFLGDNNEIEDERVSIARIANTAQTISFLYEYTHTYTHTDLGKSNEIVIVSYYYYYFY